jgi:predicted cupin superfamily sugar epimerase
MTAEEVIAELNLRPHPIEGGFFRETYRSVEVLPQGVLPHNPGQRSLATAIYYLLTPSTASALHKLPTDEIFHFYFGDPVQMLQLWPDGSSRTLILGADINHGQVPQTVVPGGVWQGSFLLSGGAFALLGATMAPGFDYTDYLEADRDGLIEKWPDRRDLIVKLTPPRSQSYSL